MAETFEQYAEKYGVSFNNNITVGENTLNVRGFGAFFRNHMGLRHRIDGPAIIGRDGINEWHINGYNVDQKIREWATTMNIDLDDLSDGDRGVIVLVWGDYGK